MKIFDVDCFLGHWPFHKIPADGVEYLNKTALDCGIEGMLVSSINSIFYDDPEEGDDEVREELREGQYQAITINPMRPCFVSEIEKEIIKFSPKAIRIVPTLHEYKLTSPETMKISALCSEAGLPLMVTALLDDPRISRFGPRRLLDGAEIESFLQNMSHCPVIFTNINANQMSFLAHQNEEFGNVYATISGFKYPSNDEIMEYTKIFPETHLLFGSCFPLYCRKSSVNIVTLGQLPEKVMEDICWNNAEKLFSL